MSGYLDDRLGLAVLGRPTTTRWSCMSENHKPPVVPAGALGEDEVVEQDVGG